MRRLIRAALCLVLHLCIGAACTVALSWMLAAFAHPESGTLVRHATGVRLEEENYQLTLELWHFPGAMWAHSGIAPHSASAFPGSRESALATLPRGTGRVVLPWLQGQPPAAWLGGTEDKYIHATGWPWLAAWHETEVRFPPQEARGPVCTTRGGIELPGRKTAGLWPGLPVALPLRPLIPGFCGDTLFFALVSFATSSAMSRGRAALRRHRGQCPGCGYDLRHDLSRGCPECGRGMPARD